MEPTWKAVLFDLDGTLIETAPEIADAVNDTLAHLGQPCVGGHQCFQLRQHGARGGHVLAAHGRLRLAHQLVARARCALFINGHALERCQLTFQLVKLLGGNVERGKLGVIAQAQLQRGLGNAGTGGGQRLDGQRGRIETVLPLFFEYLGNIGIGRQRGPCNSKLEKEHDNKLVHKDPG